MLEADLVNRTLAVAMRTGADFAEIFAEDRRSASAVLDDGRVEEVVSGRDRGAGIRVVSGDTTGFAHTADLSAAGLAAAADAAAAAARRGGGGTRTVAVSALQTPARREGPAPGEDGIGGSARKRATEARAPAFRVGATASSRSMQIASAPAPRALA